MYGMRNKGGHFKHFLAENWQKLGREKMHYHGLSGYAMYIRRLFREAAFSKRRASTLVHPLFSGGSPVPRGAGHPGRWSGIGRGTGPVGRIASMPHATRPGMGSETERGAPVFRHLTELPPGRLGASRPRVGRRDARGRTAGGVSASVAAQRRHVRSGRRSHGGAGAAPARPDYLPLPARSAREGR